ncbi:TPA: hypothetical protein I9Z65_001599 [Clostridium perfringens]|nr:hypothetical protein [Clostridium perfringens]HBC2033400.1 hypothetical protein [Clostridium perfringens]HBC2055354.1 hypothetical protein [Clostridium perfringens]HBC2070078.1 hypothetical protein [Clostridium perfringens]
MLDIIYNSCETLGSIFGFGALEGFIIYAGIVSYGVLKATGTNKENKIVMARGK